MAQTKENALAGQAFAEWLRSMRALRGMEVQEVAEKANLTQPYITMLSQGIRKPSRASILKIAAALGVDPGPGLVSAGMTVQGVGGPGEGYKQVVAGRLHGEPIIITMAQASTAEDVDRARIALRLAFPELSAME